MHYNFYSLLETNVTNNINNNSTNSFYDFLLTIHPIGLGCIFTTINWLLTTLGAAVCFFFICCKATSSKVYNLILELLFGIGGGIMLAASFFSLLSPAVELSEKQYKGGLAVVPVFSGFLLGILSFIVFDILVDYLNDYVEKKKNEYDREIEMLKEKEKSTIDKLIVEESTTNIELNELNGSSQQQILEEGLNINTDSSNRGSVSNNNGVTTPTGEASQERFKLNENNVKIEEEEAIHSGDEKHVEIIEEIKSSKVQNSWKRKLSTLLVTFRRSFLLILSMTIHNLPEGIIVGVAFGSIGDSKEDGISIANAVSLSIGVGIQNIPEGLSVSLPLIRDGASPLKAFLMGSASALIEIVGGLIGGSLVYVSKQILPYALSFAAACMVFVVVNELIPEFQKKDEDSHSHHHRKETTNKDDILSKEDKDAVPQVNVVKKSRFYKLTSRLGAAGFFVGFIVMMVLDVLL
ncbi:hypothetical protein ABK040_001612 [Willaertia magna]